MVCVCVFQINMRPGPLNTFLMSLYFFITTSALPRDKYREISTGSEFVPAETTKSGNSDLGKEPSCEELRAMWRFSKRQSRAAEITNEIPTYRDPFAFNIWEDYARPRSAGRGRFGRPLIYGRVIHNPQRSRTPENSAERNRVFQDVLRAFDSNGYATMSYTPRRKTSFRVRGGGAGMRDTPVHSSQFGSFQHLKQLIRNEKARELQEQRMSEEAAARAAALKDVVGNIQFGRMVQDQSSPSGLSYRQEPEARDDMEYKVGSSRSRSHREGVVNFPDMLAPSKYDLPPLTYKQRSYGDSTVSNSVCLKQVLMLFC